MRLFVALDVTAAVREAIAQFCAKLRPALPDARWVRPEAIHVTLKFIGEIAANRLAAFRNVLCPIHSATPVHMEFRGVGFFPDARRPCVFWADIIATPNLAEIVEEIESQLEPLGIARESHEFRPHLTLARIDRTSELDRLHAALQKMGVPNFGDVHTNEMHLIQSELGRGGARYTKIQTYNFTTAN